MRSIDLLAAGAAALVLAVSPAAGRQAAPAPAANPVLALDTAKGAIEIELFASETPKSAQHILALMKRGVYRGQRFHRVTASLVQWGDPQTRDMTKINVWGNGGSGSPIGVFELSKKRSHVRGAVGLAHAGDPLGASSQLYIMKASSPNLDGKYAIIGRVTAGMAVVDKIAVTDLIKNATVK